MTRNQKDRHAHGRLKRSKPSRKRVGSGNIYNPQDPGRNTCGQRRMLRQAARLHLRRLAGWD